MSIFGIFTTATKGMAAQSFSIKTTSNNIANANTEGFSRQRTNLETSFSNYYAGVGQIGTGVDVTSITRIRDENLDAQINYETSINGTYTASQDALEQVENIFLEPSDTGLRSDMDAMWDGWQELSKTPEGSNARTIVTQNAQTFTNTLNHMSYQIDTLQKNTISTIEGKVYEVNTNIDEIQTLSDQIYKLELNGVVPNDLLDRRGVLLEQLSQKINISTVYDKYDRVEITEVDSGVKILDFNTKTTPPNEMSVIRSVDTDASGDQELTIARGGDISDVYKVTVPKAMPPVTYQDGELIYLKPADFDSMITAGVNSTTTTVLDLSKAALDPARITKTNLNEGEVAGNFAALTEINGYQDELDMLAFSIATAINKLHADDGTGGGGGIPFFTIDTASTDTVINANNIRVNPVILNDINKINARFDPAATTKTGDGSRALAIAQLRNAQLPISDSTSFTSYINTVGNFDPVNMTFKTDPSGTTFDGYYKDIVAKIGVDTKQAKDGVENQNTLLLQLDQRRESISGVSIDEEVANLVQYQNVYAANAKVISTVIDMLDTLINRLGV